MMFIYIYIYIYIEFQVDFGHYLSANQKRSQAGKVFFDFSDLKWNLSWLIIVSSLEFFY